MNMRSHKQGFTLIELVIVIVILGIVSVGVSGFIRSGAQIFVDSTERDQLLSDSRFVIERLNRELRNALPNSVILNDNGNLDCIQFVPVGWSTFYTQLPILPVTSDSIFVAELFDFADNSYAFAGVTDDPDFAVVYPTSASHVYDLAQDRRIEVTACSDDGDGDCSTQDDSAHLATLSINNDGFFTDSPAYRLYLVRDKVSYCVDYNNDQILRYQDGIDDSIYSSTAALMAENVANLDQSDDRPFAFSEATLTRNAMVTIMLRFERNDERVEFSNEVHIANVP